MASLLHALGAQKPLAAPADLGLAYGDVIEGTAWWRAPLPARNPGAFDSSAWLARQRIFRTATIYRTDTCVILARDQGNRLRASALEWRDRFAAALRAGLEREPKLVGVLAGMVIGERAEIPPDVYAAFQRTGVFHVFAISGLHVGIVATVILVVLLLARVAQRWCGVVALPVLLLYVLATGARPGAVRALVMALVMFLGWALVRPLDLLSSLAAAVLVILLWEPLQVFDGGFILSVTAVLALLVVTPPVEVRLGRWLGPDPFLPAQLRSRWQEKLAAGGHWFTRAVSASVAVWVGLVPLMAVYFYLFAPVTVLANVVVVPILGVICALGLLAAVAHSGWTWLTLTLNNANYFLLTAMIHGVEWLQALPFGHWFVKTPPGWWCAGYYGGLAVVVSGLLARRQRRWVAGLMFSVLGAMLWLAHGRGSLAEITILDLNRGAAAFVNLPGEQHDLLIDGGDAVDGERVVLPFLRWAGVDQLGAMVATCADKAHTAGLRRVLADIPAETAVEAAPRGRSRFYKQWQADLRTRGVPVRVLRAGDDWPAAPAMRLRALHPPAGGDADRREDNVLVLMLECGPTRVLWLSAASEEVERALVASGQDLRAQILVREGGGGETSCGADLLAAVQPQVVILQTEAWPADREPHPDFVDRLQQRGVRLIRTAEAGAVTLRLRPEGYEIRTWFD